MCLELLNILQNLYNVFIQNAYRECIRKTHPTPSHLSMVTPKALATLHCQYNTRKKKNHNNNNKHERWSACCPRIHTHAHTHILHTLTLNYTERLEIKQEKKNGLLLFDWKRSIHPDTHEKKNIYSRHNL